MTQSLLPLTISVVTPSYKQADWLRLCAASVADQSGPGFTVEHIVQDALSGSEVAEALQSFPNVRLVSEKDSGMYDAINRGWDKATGNIICWLNCDEQYLPGTLALVADYFRVHPQTDVLFGDAAVVNEDGGYLCSRQVLVPHLYHTWICHLATLSCATFFRRQFLLDHATTFDTRWRMAGDAALMLRIIQSGARMDVLRRYLATFVDNGENLGLLPRAVEEHRALAAEAPRWSQPLSRLWVLHHRLRRLWHGLYRPQPFTYDIHTRTSPQKRVHFEVARPTFYWSTRMN
ncbi:MAG: glycosyltransferase [Methylacidiphilales bacterium]|nr:glycosyltransferase [Candidatus Methylacidiphilales bacterium]